MKQDPYDSAWSIIHLWWTSLEGLTGARANLKRARNPDMVATQFIYFDLFNKLMNSDIPDFIKKSLYYRLPIVAGIISHIKKDDLGRTVAAAMGSSGKAGSDKALVSDLRFRRLLRTEDGDELFIMMIRMIRMLDGKANVKDMIRSIFYWGDQTRKKWASQYYLKKDMFLKNNLSENENSVQGVAQ